MTYCKSIARRQFRRWSRSYDRSIVQWLLFEPSHDMLLQRLNLRPDADVLDIGCGTGILAARALERFPGCRVCGLDLCAPMLKQAARRLDERLALVQADSERLPFPNDSFDVVLNTNCFHHFPNQPRAVGEMHRVLRSGGEALIVDGDRDRLWGRIVYDLLVVTFEGRVQHASAARFRRLVEEAGFIDVRQETGGTVAPYLLTRCAARKAPRVLSFNSTSKSARRRPPRAG